MKKLRKNIKRFTSKYMLLQVTLATFLLFSIFSVTGLSWARFSSESNVKNEFKTPIINADIQESNEGNTYNGWINEGINWGADMGKFVRFANNGTGSIVIRASYAQNWSIDNDGEIALLSNYFLNEGLYLPVASPNWTAQGFLNPNLWYLGDDGWYYYRYVLGPGESTDDIIDYVSFASDAEIIYGEASYNLIFSVESCQYSLNSDNENELAAWTTFGMTYTELGGLLTWSNTAP
jgi:alternate signal-mediated exported protein